MSIKDLPQEVRTVQQFIGMAQGMVDNLHLLIPVPCGNCGAGCHDGTEPACILARSLTPVAESLEAHFNCTFEGLPMEEKVPKVIVSELMTLKGELYDPYIDKINQIASLSA